jgi:two-component system cell cycle sensor histidine kinase/response regulator CckA
LLHLAEDTPARASLNEIKEITRHAGHLTRQMLAYSGKGQFLVKPVDLNGQIVGMTRLLQASATKKAVVRFDLGAGLPMIQADPAQIQQVVMNLLTNASDALGEAAGTITLHTGLLDAHRAPQARGDADLQPEADQVPAEGRYIFIRVSDTGCGMDAETRARIFEPFFTTKFTGRGLGLAAVLGIVRGHNGAILVDTKPGEGTTFTVLFPCPPTPLKVIPAATRPVDATGATGTVLIVDDERIVHDTAARLLEHAGFAVLATGVAREGIELFRRHADEIDAVLLDMTMPELSGEEVFRELRRIRPDVRVVLTSGYTEQDALCRFGEQGLVGFISKPYESAALIARMRQAVRA